MHNDLQLSGRFWNEQSVTNDRHVSNEGKTANTGGYTMNICEFRHSPKYKIVYKGVKGSKYNPEWMVCQNCLESKGCFADKEQILSVITIWIFLDNYTC